MPENAWQLHDSAPVVLAQEFAAAATAAAWLLQDSAPVVLGMQFAVAPPEIGTYWTPAELFFNAAETPVIQRSALFVGVGMVAATRTAIRSRGVTLPGTGALSATATRVRDKSALVSGAGQVVTASPVVVRERSATLGGQGSLVATAIRIPTSAPVGATPVGGLVLPHHQRRRSASAPHFVPVDSASYEGLRRALAMLVVTAFPPRPLAPVVRPSRIPLRTRLEYGITTRRRPASVPLLRTAPTVPRPQPRPAPLPPPAPVPAPPPVIVPPPPPPPVLPEERRLPRPLAVPLVVTPSPATLPDPVVVEQLLAEVAQEAARALVRTVPPTRYLEDDDERAVTMMLTFLLED